MENQDNFLEDQEFDLDSILEEFRDAPEEPSEAALPRSPTRLRPRSRRTIPPPLRKRRPQRRTLKPVWTVC